MGTLHIRYPVDLIDGREDIDCDIEVNMSGKFRPAQVLGPPEDCHPAEYPDIEIEKAVTSRGEDVTALLTGVSEQSVIYAIQDELTSDDSVYDEDDYDDWDLLEDADDYDLDD